MTTEEKKKSGYSSKWESQMDALLQAYESREDFTFDSDSDALYQRYKDRYIRQGKLAMADTMGQAAALTGGYGNSYAQSAGQQTYNRYLEQLNDRVPELYEMALETYDRQGQALLDRYALLQDRDNEDYSRYQDQAALAKYQVEAMLALGAVPSQELLEQSGLSSEYIAALLSRGSAGGGSGGGGGGRRSGRGGSGKTSDAAGDGAGIDTTRNQNGLKASAWDYTLNNLDRLLAAGQTKKAKSYMSQVKGQMNQSQYVQAANTWSKYGKKW